MLAHTGLHDVTNKQIVSLLCLIVQTPWGGQHSCSNASDCVVLACPPCEFSLLWYQLSTNVLQFIVPTFESPVPVQDVPDVGGLLEARAKAAETAAGKRCDLVARFASLFAVADLFFFSDFWHFLSRAFSPCTSVFC